MTDPYRILVTGSRDWSDQDAVWRALADTVRPIPPDREIVIVHGACQDRHGRLRGADAHADAWARQYGATTEAHPAQGHPTEDFGPWPAAGPRRNAHMVRRGADAALAFIGPCTSYRCRRPEPHGSHGATGCADLAEHAGIPTRRFTP